MWQQESCIFGNIERSARNTEGHGERNAVRLSIAICGQEGEEQDRYPVLRQVEMRPDIGVVDPKEVRAGGELHIELMLRTKQLR